MARGTTTHRRATTRLLALAAVALLLAGCIKFDTDLTVSSDDTVAGEIIFGFDRALLEMGGGTVDDFMADDLAPVPPDVEGVTVEEWEDENFIGQRFVLEAVPLEEFNAGGETGALQIVRDGDVFRLSGNMDMSGGQDLAGGEDLGMDPSLFLGDAELEVSVTFPGEVLETNGEVEGTTVTWEPSLTGTNEFTAVANAEVGGVSNRLLWILLIVALLIALAVVAFVLARRRSEPAAATAQAGAAPAGTGAADTGPVGTAPPPATTTPPPPPPPSSGSPATTPPPSSPPGPDDTVEIPGQRDDTTPMPPPPPPN